MRCSTFLLLLAIFFVVAGYSSSSFALSCRVPSNFILGQCSKTHCSKAFLVEYQWLNDGCSTKSIVSDADPAALNAFLKASPPLPETEQLIVFGHQTQCTDNKANMPKDLSYISQKGQHCHFELTTNLVNATSYIIQRKKF